MKTCKSKANFDMNKVYLCEYGFLKLRDKIPFVVKWT